ncbi:hypothetical protein ABGB18_23260 [Nonomuraea sp. B12E4]|uniref:hypothetical protein n=1 Tax=Nonomuraea sp. B12E4 TaxID=3153564 RepID=UPI00325D5006
MLAQRRSGGRFPGPIAPIAGGLVAWVAGGLVASIAGGSVAGITAVIRPRPPRRSSWRPMAGAASPDTGTASVIAPVSCVTPVSRSRDIGGMKTEKA